MCWRSVSPGLPGCAAGGRWTQQKGHQGGCLGTKETQVHSVCGEPLGDLGDGSGTQFEGRVHWVCWGAGWGWGASKEMRKMKESRLEQLLVMLLEGWGPSEREGFSETSAAVGGGGPGRHEG